MFDIGFWELVALAVIALLIIGPEQLPRLARDAGKIIGQVRSFIQHARQELERELDIDERKQLQDSIDHVEQLMKEAPDRLLEEDDKNQPAN